MKNDQTGFEDPHFIDDNWSILNLNIAALAPSKLFLLTDTHTNQKCLPILKEKLDASFDVMTIPHGESNKNLQTAAYIWQFMADNGADRQSLLINLGGGVVTDIGAFCAATYMRGIRYIQIPTSVLAMTDAALGGKTGIDLGILKNYIGTFSHAEGIYIYPDFVKTLPQLEKISGLGEIIKHAIIEGGELWSLIQNKSPVGDINWHEILFLSTKVKVDIVSRDPKETGLRKVLNFGHTFGHAFESYSLLHDQKPLKHGEAIAHGMICALILSIDKVGLDRDLSIQMISIIKNYFAIRDFPKNTWSDLYEIMIKDKKNNKGVVNAILLEKIGYPIWNQPISYNEFKRTMEHFL